jgi:hypothetical protein
MLVDEMASMATRAICWDQQGLQCMRAGSSHACTGTEPGEIGNPLVRGLIRNICRVSSRIHLVWRAFGRAIHLVGQSFPQDTPVQGIPVALQVIGSGSEMILDVAPGVDWTAVCGMMMCMQQVPTHVPLCLHLPMDDSLLQ